jgi:signal transduction histidine kinase
MLLLAVVVVSVLAVTVYSNYQNSYNQIQDSLGLALGRSANESWRPAIGNQPGKGDYTPVFVVSFNSLTGAYVTSDSQQSVQMSQADIAQAVSEVIASGRASGELGDLNLFYKQTSTAQALLVGQRIAFADSSQLGAQTLRQALLAGAVGLAALVVLFLISMLLGRIAVGPVEAAWRRERKFIADASHELKTPLTVIMANNSIIESLPESKVSEQRQWLEATDAEASKMDKLVRDLLSLAQSDAAALEGKTKPRRKAKRKLSPALAAIDFSRVVEREAMQFEAVFFERQISFESTVEPAVQVLIASEKAARLVTILLDNASKYANPGGNVNLSLTTSGHLSELIVQNSGTVIPEDKLVHLFDRFYRVDEAHSSQVEGFGLGLSLAKNIVESAKGHISVTSDTRLGTVFRVVFPLAK